MLKDQNYSELMAATFQWIDEHTQNSLLLCDPELRVRYVSNSVTRNFGFSEKSLTGKSLYSFVHPEDLDRLTEDVYQLGYNESLETKYRVINLNQLEKYHRVSIGKFYHASTAEIFFIFLTEDITNQLKSEDLLIQSEKLSSAGQLAASVAHEIRNPLTSLKGFLQLMESGVQGQAEYFQIMKDEIEKIETITSELLYIAKPSTQTFHEEDIIQIVREVCILMRSQARSYDIKLINKFDVDQYNLTCDRSQMKQVIINLVKNAIEAMNQEGQIEVHIHTKKDFIIEVKDEGPGVPDILKEKLGEPFFTTKQTGTGLGLMVTNQILQNHGAKLLILDREHGGSNFRIEFH